MTQRDKITWTPDNPDGSGWARHKMFDRDCYRYEHIHPDEAQEMEERGEDIHVIVTINRSQAEDGSWHRNLYFVFGVEYAIARAAAMVVYLRDVCETIVEIRRPTDAEYDAFWVANPPPKE